MGCHILNVPYFTFTVKLFEIIIGKVVDLGGWERKVSQVFSNSYGLSLVSHVSVHSISDILRLLIYDQLNWRLHLSYKHGNILDHTMWYFFILSGKHEAISDIYSIISNKKVFSTTNINSKGQAEANPRLPEVISAKC
jgi:hypothetical protein